METQYVPGYEPSMHLVAVCYLDTFRFRLITAVSQYIDPLNLDSTSVSKLQIIASEEIIKTIIFSSQDSYALPHTWGCIFRSFPPGLITSMEHSKFVTFISERQHCLDTCTCLEWGIMLRTIRHRCFHVKHSCPNPVQIHYKSHWSSF